MTQGASDKIALRFLFASRKFKALPDCIAFYRVTHTIAKKETVVLALPQISDVNTPR